MTGMALAVRTGQDEDDAAQYCDRRKASLLSLKNLLIRVSVKLWFQK